MRTVVVIISIAIIGVGFAFLYLSVLIGAVNKEANNLLDLEDEGEL
jgi:hypothetical protein